MIFPGTDDVLSMAARTHPEMSNRGIQYRMVQVISKILREKYPNLSASLYSTIYSPKAAGFIRGAQTLWHMEMVGIS